MSYKSECSLSIDDCITRSCLVLLPTATLLSSYTHVSRLRRLQKKDCSQKTAGGGRTEVNMQLLFRTCSCSVGHLRCFLYQKKIQLQMITISKLEERRRYPISTIHLGLFEFIQPIFLTFVSVESFKTAHGHLF